MNPVQTDIGEILTDMASGPRIGGHVSKMETLMRHFSSRGVSLETAADSKHLNRSPETLQRYARRLGLKFVDYVPMALRPKKPKPEKKARK